MLILLDLQQTCDTSPAVNVGYYRPDGILSSRTMLRGFISSKYGTVSSGIIEGNESD